MRNRKINCEFGAKHIIDGKVVWSLKQKYQTILVADGDDLICELKNGVPTGRSVREKKK